VVEIVIAPVIFFEKVPKKIPSCDSGSPDKIDDGVIRKMGLRTSRRVFSSDFFKKK